MSIEEKIAKLVDAGRVRWSTDPPHECPDPECDHNLTEGHWFGKRCADVACACPSCKQPAWPYVLRGRSTNDVAGDPR